LSGGTKPKQSVEKIGSFDFAVSLKKYQLGKTKCAKCVSAIKLFLKNVGGKKIKIYRVGLRVG